MQIGIIFKCNICNKIFILNEQEYLDYIYKEKYVSCIYNPDHSLLSSVKVVGKCKYKITLSLEKKYKDIEECFKEESEIKLLERNLKEENIKIEDNDKKVK